MENKQRQKEMLTELVNTLKKQDDYELLEYLRKEIMIACDEACLTYDSFIRLQRNKMRSEGRMFYKNIKEQNNQKQLVNDYAYMLWYKSIRDIPRMFSYVYFQIEDMLNYYILHSDQVLSISCNRNKYIYVKELAYINKPFVVDVYNSFFDANGQLKNLKDISIWAKYVYWLYTTGKDKMFWEPKHNLFSDMVNLRNLNELRSIEQNNNHYITKQIHYWQINIEGQFGYITNLLKSFVESIYS